MNLLYYGFAVLVFIAVALTMEAIWQWWFSTQSRAARKFSQRIRSLGGTDAEGAQRVSLLKERRFADSDRLHEWLRKLRVAESLDIHLQQAGSRSNVGSLLAWCAVAFSLGLVTGLLLMPGWLLALVFAFICALVPLLMVSRQRVRRLNQIQQQLPEVADLIARSLRAGHALPSTLQMAAEEMPEPICSEFRRVSDEINYGLGLQSAMQRLAERVPIDDLRFLVISVLIQRETGGNLAELMQNMASLIRERLKLLGQVKALSAEGRMSGWILFLLPIAMALLLLIVNPAYIMKLVEDTTGQTMLAVATVQMLLGGLWMRSIVNLKV
jgi:tight adherence protein B